MDNQAGVPYHYCLTAARVLPENGWESAGRDGWADFVRRFWRATN